MLAEAFPMLSEKARSVLAEIAAALERLQVAGEIATVFINRMALSQEERQTIRDFLGEGSISITLGNSDEPAEWLESGFSGVWYGVFYDKAGNPMLETIEVAHFPQVAAAQAEDIIQGITALKQRLADADKSEG